MYSIYKSFFSTLQVFWLEIQHTANVSLAALTDFNVHRVKI